MSENKTHTPALPGRAAPLLVADAVYLVMVYVFFITIPPLGRDYASLARPDSILFFRGLVRVFEGHSWAYLLANLALLYGCMAVILALTRRLTGGPWWLGSVAAVLFMANPVKTEAVLNISGIRELWPGLMALATLYAYLCCRPSERRGARWLPLIVYLAAILTGPINIMLFAVVIVLECVMFKQAPRRWLPIAVVGAIALLASGQWAMPGSLHPARMFVPLFFTAYPIGILPDTAGFFQNWPVAGYVVGVAFLVVAVWLIRRVNNPAFTFGLVGAAAFRIGQGGFAVDAVTLKGGGQLLLPAALLSIAVAGFFHAVMGNDEWRKTVVRVTTLLCVAAMCCQIWVNIQWRYAGREVQRFQTCVADAVQNNPGKPVAIVPDIQYYRTAPMMLYESVNYHTPFSTRQPVVPLLSVSVLPPVKIAVERYSPESVTVTLLGLAVPEPDAPPLFSRDWWLHRHQPPPPVTIHLDADAQLFPDICLDYWR